MNPETPIPHIRFQSEFCEGRVLAIGGVDHVVVNRNSDDQLVLQNQKTGRFLLEKTDKIIAQIDRGKTIIKQRIFDDPSIDELFNDAMLRNPPKSEKDRRKKQRMLEYIRDAVAQEPRGENDWKACLAQTAIRIGDIGGAPCSKTVKGWRKKFFAVGQRANFLAPIVSNRGRPTVISFEHHELLTKNHCENFLVQERPSFRSAYDFYLEKIRKYNADNPDEPQIQAISYWTYIRHLNRCFHPREIYERRYGKRAADIKWRRLNKGHEFSRILEQVIIDSTPADILISYADGMYVARPWITAVIDSYSRCILAIVITFAPPSIDVLAQALRLAIRTKKEIQGKYEITGSDYFGIMRSVIVDNALEYHSNFLIDACADLNIDLQYQPKGEPWWKAMLERWFGTLANEIHNLPGTTQSCATTICVTC